MSDKPLLIEMVSVVAALVCHSAVAQDAYVAEAKAYVTEISKPHPSETVVKAFRLPDAIKYSHVKPQEISRDRRID